MNDFRYYDHIDREAIVVSKNSLLLIFKGCREYFSSASAAWGFAGVGVTLLVAGLITQNFYSLLSVPGETIRAVFLVLGVVMIGFSIRYAIKWNTGRVDHEPEIIIAKLLEKQPEPLMLPAPLASDIPKKSNSPKRVQQKKTSTHSNRH
jgi:hypothetical protein